MESEKHVGRTISCACGKTHRIDPREVLYADDAVAQCPALCARHCKGRSVSVVMDVRTRQAAGLDVMRALTEAGWAVREVLVPDRPDGQSPVTDEATKGEVEARIGEADLVVSVGSGVISDLGKWVAFERDLPAAVFGTAASMNGYAAANVAASVEGVKVVVRARPPAAVASSPKVLADAPYELTASGLGDVLAKSVSSADWRLNHLLFGDYYCERSVSLIAEIEPLYLDHPEDIRQRRRRALEALFDALLLTGMAMTMAETSDPASGGEHLISHTLDMRASVEGAAHDRHGKQVGVGTILASEIYRRVLAVESPAFTTAPAGIDPAFWGPLRDAVGRELARKVPRYETAAAKLSQGRAWDELREELSAMVRPPERISDCLRRAGAAYRAEDIGIDRRRLLAALLHAHEMRGRFTILDLARLVGVMPHAATDVVDQWA